MPELPEVETIRLQLNQVLEGLKISQIEVLSEKNFIGQPQQVIGRKVREVERRAKIVLIKLTDNQCLAIHLKLTGQLIFRNTKVTIREQNSGPFAVGELPNKYTRVIISFTPKGKLYFNDLRKFGWVKVISTKQECQALSELQKLGPEAIDEKAFTLNYFKQILSKSSRAVKLVIMDQEKLAGVGNIYANEALFMAGVRPDKPANKLKSEEAERLRKAIIKVLRQAVKHKGTSDKDEAYRQISGQKGSHQDYLLVYGKDKQDCPSCKGKIRRIKIGGRGTFFCPKCQK